MLSVLAGSSLGRFGDACPTANGVRDPHLHFAHGGTADFRGRHNALYNFLSAPGLALNVKTEESTFRMNGGKLTVDGTWMTEAHVIAISRPKGEIATASFWASKLNSFNTGTDQVNGTCGGRPFVLGMGWDKQCEEMRFAVGYSTATWTIHEWIISVHGTRSHPGLISGPAHRIDISLRAKGPVAASLPHGLVGQSFSTPGLPRIGMKDHYPASGRFRTAAMAEGAIDGEAKEYEVVSAHSTHFAFSRFYNSPPEPSQQPAAPAAGSEASAMDAEASDVDAAAVEAALGPPRARRLSDCDSDGIPDADEGSSDSDSDGVPDSQESNTDDADSDGSTDANDADSDNDGIPDAEEGTADSDGDGIPDHLDPDSDGDGIPDAEEGNGDADSDGIPDAKESNTNDPDNDGLPNHLDPDSDGDGIGDAEESNGDPDSDGIPNYLDPDSDGDNRPDAEEGTADTDSDGAPNFLKLPTPAPTPTPTPSPNPAPTVAAYTACDSLWAQNKCCDNGGSCPTCTHTSQVSNCNDLPDDAACASSYMPVANDQYHRGCWGGGDRFDCRHAYYDCAVCPSGSTCSHTCIRASTWCGTT